MLTLQDLCDLDRPGCGRRHDLVWAEFIADPRIERLRWPIQVLDQFLFFHGKNEDFLDEYGTVDLTTISWICASVSTIDLMLCNVASFAQEYVDEIQVDYESWFNCRTEAERKNWEERGTWLMPPVIFDTDVVGGLRRQLVEGHTRLAILRARYDRGLAVSAMHQAFIGNRPP